MRGLDKVDVYALKWHWLIASAILLFWALGFSTIIQLNSTQNEALNAQQAIAHNYQQQTRTLLDKRRSLTALNMHYTTLMQQGVIGEERRTAWIEALHSAQKSSGVARIKYSVIPKAAYPTNTLAGLVHLRLQHSVMSIDVDLRHEEQFINVLNALNAHTPALFLWRSCELTRLSAIAAATTPNIHAMCMLDWITLNTLAQTNKTPL